MIFLLDVNFLLACAWASHEEHHAAGAWLNRQKSFVTCPLTELGFLRVSLSPGYRATPALAREGLADLTDRPTCQFLPAALRAAEAPLFATHSQATDAYLVALAERHGLKLATLDEALCRQSWAQGIAVNPLR